MRNFSFVIVLMLIILFPSKGIAAQIIKIKHQDGDMTEHVRKAIEKSTDKNISIFFEKGIYHFYSDYALGTYLYITNHGNGFKKVIFNFQKFDSISIDGNGSEFIFHGALAPFVFEDCHKIDISNLTLDWDIPFTFQADVIGVDQKAKFIDIKPYVKGFSWKFSRGKLLFPNIDGFQYSILGSTLAHDKNSKIIDHGARDMHLDPSNVEELDDGIYRIYQSNLNYFPRVGTILNAKGDREKDRYAPAFLIRRSKNISIDHVVVHHALGMGFLFERSESIKLLNSGVYIRKDSDRVISTTADATHFANCKGQVLIENCRLEGMYDDGTNVHGTYVEVDRVLDENTVRVALKHFEQLGFEFAVSGDEIWFIKSPDPQRSNTGKVKEVVVINDTYIDLTFFGKLPIDLKPGDILENKTWNPEFTMRGNQIKDHRARNIIIKTPRKILIEDNDLSSMMSSIMLRGESYFWFESGNVEEVVIRNNRFVHCAYGGTEHAVLRISPRLGKRFDQTIQYDRNIVFENNTIETFDNRIIWADRVDGLIIRGNSIEQTFEVAPLFPDAHLFDFENCTNIEIYDNVYKGNCVNSIKTDSVSQQKIRIKNNKGFINLN